MAFTTTKRELWYLEKAIRNNGRRLEEISRQFHLQSGVCCVSCWSSEYRFLALKKERQEKRYWELYNKITIHEAPQGDDRLIDELITHYQSRVKYLTAQACAIRSKGWRHYAEAGAIDTKRLRLVVRLQKILRRIAPTHPLGHLNAGYPDNVRIPVYTPPRLPELPKFGEEP